MGYSIVGHVRASAAKDSAAPLLHCHFALTMCYERDLRAFCLMPVMNDLRAYCDLICLT